MFKPIIPLAMAGLIIASIAPAQAGTARASILEKLQTQAGQPFSAERGKMLFSSTHKGGKPKTPSCTSCHTKSPRNVGKTRAGKEIAPMALSKTKDRYSDPKKVAKWFRRNCRSVLGRECTPLEKGDFITFMSSQ